MISFGEIQISLEDSKLLEDFKKDYDRIIYERVKTDFTAPWVRIDLADDIDFTYENDLIEAIIALPTELFYNTEIATYIWVLSKNKRPERKGKIQLIDASNIYHKLRKALGKKKLDDYNAQKPVYDAII